jgi:hypothetical protein
MPISRRENSGSSASCAQTFFVDAKFGVDVWTSQPARGLLSR